MHDEILDWYAGHARELPWRGPSASPWSVMVSEFMLQQTPVARVLPVHEEWLRRWPTPADLAAESTGEAVRAWGRLGYPRRALRLHAAAVTIVERHGGEVPSSYDDLLALPGVGDYTAAAIASFAYGRRHVVLDTNVRRVLARSVAGVEFPGALPDAGRARAGGRPAAGRRRDRGDLVGRADGARRAGLHGQRAAVRRLPDRRLVRVAGGRLPGVRRPAPAGAGVGRHRPAVPRTAARRGARRGGRRTGARLDAAWPDAAQRERCLASLLEDRLLVRTDAGDYALP